MTPRVNIKLRKSIINNIVCNADDPEQKTIDKIIKLLGKYATEEEIKDLDLDGKWELPDLGELILQPYRCWFTNLMASSPDIKIDLTVSQKPTKAMLLANDRITCVEIDSEI